MARDKLAPSTGSRFSRRALRLTHADAIFPSEVVRANARTSPLDCWRCRSRLLEPRIDCSDSTTASLTIRLVPESAPFVIDAFFAPVAPLASRTYSRLGTLACGLMPRHSWYALLARHLL